MWPTGSTCPSSSPWRCCIWSTTAIPVVLLGAKAIRCSRRAGCADPVVVRPQRGRLLPDRGLPRHDVLLRAQAGRTPGLLYRLSIVHFLVADLSSTSGPARITCTYTACPTGPRPWAWSSRSCCGCRLGRHDQRADDAVGRLGQAAHRSDLPHDGVRWPSTACRPSKAR